jgi:glycerol-3-phosphate acyltransferase PlsY
MAFISFELSLALIAFATYLFASIPFGLLISKWFGLGDIRTIGSGNIGATNVLRSGNKKAAILTLLLDCMKGAIVVIVCKHIAPEYQYSIGFLAVFSHVFSVYLKFRGGKGVATALGVFLAFEPLFGISILCVWVVVAKLFKISSLAALISAVSAPFIAYFFKLDFNLITFSALISVLILFTHRDNIKRIFNKTESVITVK